MCDRLGRPRGLVRVWERGFPTHAFAKFRELREAWLRLAFRIPIRELNVYGVSEADCAEFVTWPALSLLSALQVVHVRETTGPSPNVLPMIANCAELRSLEALTLWDTLYSEATVTALLDSPHLTGLNALRLQLDPDTTDLSEALKARLVARFGVQVFADPIPF